MTYSINWPITLRSAVPFRSGNYYHPAASIQRSPPTVNAHMGAGTGEQGGQAPTLEKIRVGMAHPGNFSPGLKTSWQ